MRTRSMSATVVLSVIGIGLSVMAASFLYLHVIEKAVDDFEAQVDEAVKSFEHEADFQLEVLDSLTAFFEATGNVDRDQFHTFARPLLARRPEIQALEWIPRITANDRTPYEASVRREGFAGFRIRELDASGGLAPAVDRAEYFPVSYIEPMRGNQAVHGFDLASDATRRAALEASRREGRVRATAPVTLLQETEGQTGFLALAAVRGPGAAPDDRPTLRGFIAGVYRVGDIFDAAPGIVRAEADKIELRLYDHAPDGEVRLLHRGRAEAAPVAARIEHRVDLEVAGRHWSVVAKPGVRYVDARNSWEPYAILALGLLLTGGLVGYVRVAATRTRAVERLVDARTDDLREANRRLEQERSILQAVLDNLGDGVAVTDEEGKLTLFNPAAEEILGMGLLAVGPEEWSETYGLFHPETHQPIPAEDLPLARAVAGLESPDVEMFVRNPSKPGGTFIRVTATPLKDRTGELRGGVAVFRDVSERKWTEAVLQDSATRFRAIVEASASALIILAPDYRIREFNPQAESIFGQNRAQALGQNFLELCLPVEYREAVAADVRRALAGESTPGFETPTPSRTGAERTLLWHFSRLAEGDDKGAVVIATGLDITERKQAEQARRVRELAAHLQSARETERTHLAREIHDELGQALTGLKLELSYLARQAGDGLPALRARLANAGAMIDGTIASVRRIAAELRPQILDELGLLEAIRWQVREFRERTQIPCVVELPEVQFDWSADRATAMFRILQEALTNVARHAAASRVSVHVAQRGERVVLEVRDDGRGFEPDGGADATSFGVLGMQERARMFGGELSVESREGQGTTVTASMPY